MSEAMTRPVDGAKLLELATDVCECGDWRSSHPNNGRCNFNSSEFDLCHGGRDCMSFRLSPQPGDDHDR